MRTPWFVPLVVGSLLCAGCLSTVRITRQTGPPADTATKVDGIPFYVKTAKCKEETVWLQPVFTVTLKKTTKFTYASDDDAKKAASFTPNPLVESHTKVLSLPQFQTKELVELRSLLSKSVPASAAEVKQIDDDWQVVSALPDYVPFVQPEDSLIKSTEVIEVSNTGAAETIVDYAHPYYYNSPRPWVGSSQVDAKLAADGTLTEGSAQNQTQTLSTILSALPISAVLTKVSELGLGLGAAGVPPPGIPAPKSQSIQYELSIQQDAYKHTHTAYSGFSVPCKAVQGGVQTDYALTIEAPGSDNAKKTDDSAIKVSGTVTLPKKKDN